MLDDEQWLPADREQWQDEQLVLWRLHAYLLHSPDGPVQPFILDPILGVTKTEDA